MVTPILMTAAVAAALLWPHLAKLARRSAVSYQEAMLALAAVRARLVQTGGVPDDAGKAIEVVTHALVEGSDK